MQLGFPQLAIFRPGIIAGNIHTPAYAALLGRLIPGPFGTIDQDDAVGRREFLTQGEPHILQIATRAMNKNDSRLSMGIVRREPERSDPRPYSYRPDALKFVSAMKQVPGGPRRRRRD